MQWPAALGTAACVGGVANSECMAWHACLQSLDSAATEAAAAGKEAAVQGFKEEAKPAAELVDLPVSAPRNPRRRSLP